MTDYRTERDSLGEIQVPADAMYAAQTQRAVENFPVSGITFSRQFIRALALIKSAAATVNVNLDKLDNKRAQGIIAAADEVAAGTWDEHFPIDIFQTGSGTSTNMNANEVIARRATQILAQTDPDTAVHPNDHVNMGQSSNDVIPTAIHVSARMAIQDTLIPGLIRLRNTLDTRADELEHVVTTGRTHLMDAMPITLAQEISGWKAQIDNSINRIRASLPAIEQLAIGGTAVGTGINAHPDFGRSVADKLSELTDLSFSEADNHFAAQAAMDAATELSGQLRTTATALMKVANDLRWMNSGPIAGLAEIALPALQPGSSIMPGKVNPVICESMMMVCCQVMGNDATIATANTHGNFQLNVMLPVIAHNLLQSIVILGNACTMLADKAVAGFTVNEERIASTVGRNPVLVTALNAILGYDKAAVVAKRAYKENRLVQDVAAEECNLSPEELADMLDPRKLTGPQDQTA